MGDRDVGGLRRSQSLVSGLLNWMSPFRPSSSSPDTSMDEQPFTDAHSAEAPPAPTSPPPPAAPPAAPAPVPAPVNMTPTHPSPYARRSWATTQAPAFHPGSFETPTKRTSPALKTTSPFAANVSPGRKHAPIYLGPGTSTRKSYSPLRSSIASTHSMSALAQQRPPMLAREPVGTPEKRLKTSTTSTQALDQVAFASPSTSALSSSTSVSSARKRPVDNEEPAPAERAPEAVEVPVRRSARHTRAASTMREVLDAMKPLEPPAPALPEVVNPYQTRSKSTAPRPTTRSTRARALEAARQRAASEVPAGDEPPKTSLLDMVERTEPLPVSPRRPLRTPGTEPLRPSATSPEGKSSVESGALRLMANKPKRPSPLSMGATSSDTSGAAPAPAAVPLPVVPPVPAAPAPAPAVPVARSTEPPVQIDTPSWCIVTAPARRDKPTLISGDQAKALDVPWDQLPVFSFDIPAARARAAPPSEATAPPASKPFGSGALSAPKDAPSLSQTSKTEESIPTTEESTKRPVFSFSASARPVAPMSKPAAPAPVAPAQAPSTEAPATDAPSTDQSEGNTLTACGQGEEDEDTSHEVRAKIWRLDAGAWQDMGVSILRIKTAKGTHKSRVLARNAVNGHVVLNFVLYQGLQVMCDKNVLTFLGFVDAKPCHLRCKVKTPDAATSLKEALMQFAQTDES
ncbi:unnamed protein product [Malassezia sympodialis ATCC 42132]|uniref:Uncharacterized protein n=1 Tax=Malassezia sympodialis (strain ATCC 42132) TaxID=1230383 RepID=M5ECQ5_MALS4|nr:uncharacterized protein MSY001_2918 [Malassezia sympodialis ATCC 42132]CCV00213.1 unnamed protein product [Malassezia sympodialis ATCC 42132]SHO78820.1 Uncharacterized protein MSYG_3168 [Malassezia sympodialis ATCC 42132]|eukprot:XP_018741419.1 uncharacterized protein MSY001_2918 [Malassezia sympodialis ATCC 42132]